MEGQSCVFLGIKVKPGPIERHKIEDFGINNSVESLRSEAEKKANVPSASLELIHHGKILKDGTTLQDSGVKNGEMVHVVKKKVQPPPEAPPSYSDAELQQIATALRTFGCTPNAPGWTRAMQILNDESTMSEIIEAVPTLGEECVTLSILHEVELLAALGNSVETMRRGADARPELPAALTQLIRLVRSRTDANPAPDAAPTSGFAYSLEALSDDEEAEEDDAEDAAAAGGAITQEQLAAALLAASEAVSAGGLPPQENFLRLLNSARERTSTEASSPSAAGNSRSVITPEMFNEAITEAISRAARPPGTPMDQSAAASSSASPARAERFATQLEHLHAMGLRDDRVNVRALMVCSGDVNEAINLIFSGAMADD